ncbi:hypothetical protein NYR55_09380 [Sphingomonas sp. BGYR3]|uniref:hypothetical protein n=1 Tax=Sphingomonas sp. BGYR3 TaxID=2975483 RepID=UPI0021A6630C|nr:hypothetical protein [Sphingomonas sp. BGYR3]MDG5488825.1 hypothetical protein [Sphingomonas sp. BGYR3]
MCVVSKITQPDGTILDFNYDTTNPTGNETTRLRSVVSSRGYALILEYSAVSSGYNAIVKSCVINLTKVLMTSSVCPATGPSTTYSYVGSFLSSVTSIDGKITNYYKTISNNNFGTFSIQRPDEAVPYVINSFSSLNNYWQFRIESQQFVTGESYSYGYNYIDQAGGGVPSIVGGYYTDSNGKKVELKYGAYRKLQPIDDQTLIVTPGPEQVIDQLGRATISDYCQQAPIGGRCFIVPTKTIRYPNGSIKSLLWDGQRRLYESRLSAAGESDIVITQAYDCAARVCQNKPTSIIDPLGRVTSYTYSSVHGGVLTEVLPAVDGVSPAKKYGYVQRYAWLKNGSGGFSPAASPIWLLSEMRTCRTTALDLSSGACAGGVNDLVLTQYEYGPDSGPNNLWLRGTAVTAQDTDGVIRTLRTCYGYDAMGRKIWETAPKAGLAQCN